MMYFVLYSEVYSLVSLSEISVLLVESIFEAAFIKFEQLRCKCLNSSDNSTNRFEKSV